MADRKTTEGMTSKKLSRSDVRKATIHGLRQAKANPRSVKITPGQRRHIVGSAKTS